MYAIRSYYVPESARLPEPIFTPATKEEKGKHDMNIPFAKMVDIVGKETAEAAPSYNFV